MQKFFRKYLAVALFFISSTTTAGLINISEQEINRYLETRLAEKVPLKDKVGIPGLFQLDYRLHNLATQIGRTAEKKVAVSGIIDGLLQAKGKKYDVRLNLNMDTTPYYDAEKGALFLKDVRLLNYSATPEKYEKELQMFIPILMDGLSGVLNRTPVYTLDETKTKEALMKKFGKAIVVNDGNLSLETSVF